MALSADYDAKGTVGEQIRVPVAANAVIYKGALCCYKADGYVIQGADTANYLFAGVAEEQVNNTGGADGAKTVLLAIKGRFEHARSGAALTDNGDPCYVVDDATLGLTGDTSNTVLVGKFRRFDRAGYMVWTIDSV